MSLDPVSQLATLLGNNIKDTQTLQENMSTSDSTPFLQTQASFVIELQVTETINKKFYATDSFILDNATYCVLDSSTLKIDGGYSGNFSETFATTSTKGNTFSPPAYWDTTNQRLTMANDNSLSNEYATRQEIILSTSSQTITQVTLGVTETKFGMDQILYFISIDGQDWEQIYVGTNTIVNTGTAPTLAVMFIGQGGNYTYIQNLTYSDNPGSTNFSITVF